MHKKTTIDASNRKIGRVASEAAIVLMGKNDPAHKRYLPPSSKVEIVNCGKADIRDKKKRGKRYTWYTGYPGGLRSQSLQELIVKKGIREAFKLAIYGMIPNNKLRPKIMKNLTIKE